MPNHPKKFDEILRNSILMHRMTLEILDPMTHRRIKRVTNYFEWLLKEINRTPVEIMRWEDDGGACNS